MSCMFDINSLILLESHLNTMKIMILAYTLLFKLAIATMSFLQNEQKYPGHFTQNITV